MLNKIIREISKAKAQYNICHDENADTIIMGRQLYNCLPVCAELSSIGYDMLPVKIFDLNIVVENTLGCGFVVGKFHNVEVVNK